MHVHKRDHYSLNRNLELFSSADLKVYPYTLRPYESKTLSWKYDSSCNSFYEKRVTSYRPYLREYDFILNYRFSVWIENFKRKPSTYNRAKHWC